MDLCRELLCGKNDGFLLLVLISWFFVLAWGDGFDLGLLDSMILIQILLQNNLSRELR